MSSLADDNLVKNYMCKECFKNRYKRERNVLERKRKNAGKRLYWGEV